MTTNFKVNPKCGQAYLHFPPYPHTLQGSYVTSPFKSSSTVPSSSRLSWSPCFFTHWKNTEESRALPHTYHLVHVSVYSSRYILSFCHLTPGCPRCMWGAFRKCQCLGPQLGDYNFMGLMWHPSICVCVCVCILHCVLTPNLFHLFNSFTPEIVPIVFWNTTVFSGV